MHYDNKECNSYLNIKKIIDSIQQFTGVTLGEFTARNALFGES